MSSNEILGSILATSDVCVSPDEANRMNDISTMNKVLEYMALGRPIVQFDLREGRVSAGGASLYAASNDVTALAKDIVQLLDDPDLGRAWADRPATAEGQSSWEMQVPNLLAAYERARARAEAKRGRNGQRDTLHRR